MWPTRKIGNSRRGGDPDARVDAYNGADTPSAVEKSLSALARELVSGGDGGTPGECSHMMLLAGRQDD